MERYDDLEMNDAELDAYLKTLDEMEDFAFESGVDFYVLAEREESRVDRIKPKELSKAFPLDAIRYQQLDKLDRESQYVEVEGDFFPDYLEEAGLHLVSIRFLEYLKQLLTIGEITYNLVGLMGEGRRRVENYCLIIPPELDCIAAGSARHDKNGSLVYFEIDPQKVGATEIFKVKGFPHLIVVDKLNRIDYVGYRCQRIEHFFDYKGCRDRDYQERVNGGALEEALRAYQAKTAGPAQVNFRERLPKLCNREKIHNQIQAGLKQIFESYAGKPFAVVNLEERYLHFRWSESPNRIGLVEDQAGVFGKTGFAVEALQEAIEYRGKLPPELQVAGERVISETLWHCFSCACKVFGAYDGIHANRRFRIYLEREQSQSPNPPLVYDFKDSWQQKVETLKDFRQMDLTGRDLREFDFSGKDLTGMKFVDVNLEQAKFHGSILQSTQFQRCNLTGTQFWRADMRRVTLLNCDLDRTNFDEALLGEAEISGSDLFHVSFVKSDLSRAMIRNPEVTKAYFYKAKLESTTFEISEICYDNVFILSDLRNAKFCETPTESQSLLTDCDFRNSNLTESVFAIALILDTCFTKAKLNQADFSGSLKLSRSDLRWAECFRLNLTELFINNCDFSFVDLSRLKEMKRIVFEGNYLFHTRLSGFDFSDPPYFQPNDLVYTDLTGCNLAGGDLRASNVIYVNFKDALLTDASFTEQQLQYVELSAKQRREIAVVSESGDEDA